MYQYSRVSRFDRKSVGFLAVSLPFLLSMPARAQFTVFTNLAQLSANRVAVPVFAGNDGDRVVSPLVLAAPGNVLTFTAQGGSAFTRVNQSANSDFGFADGTTLLETNDPNTILQTGPLQIQFTTGIREFGFQAADFNLQNGAFAVTVYNNNNQLGTFSVPADSSNSPFAAFVGGREDGATLINRIIISSSAGGTPTNDFLVGNFFITNDTSLTPEPSTLLLLAGGITIVTVRLGMRRHRRFRA